MAISVKTNLPSPRPDSGRGPANRIYPFDVVVFDCDGVMFDSSAVNTAYYNHLLDAFGRPLMNSAQRAYVHAHTVDESVAFLFQDAAMQMQVHNHRLAMDYAPFLKLMTIEPGLITLLQAVRPAMKTAIATNRTDTMDIVLDAFGLTDMFDMVVTARHVPHPKPHPAQLQKIGAALQAAPDRMLYIGDSTVDADAAVAAGVVFVAFANPALTADYHVSSMAQIHAIVFNDGRQVNGGRAVR